MALLKNIHLLNDILSTDDLSKMEHAALAHKQYSNITFKILEATKSKVVIRVVQEKSANEHHFPAKRLIEIVHETFDRFFSGMTINIKPVPYKPPKASTVDVDWINKQMLRTGTSLKDMAAETDIDKTQLSSLVTGDRPLSKPMKALFWYYFISKK